MCAVINRLAQAGRSRTRRHGLPAITDVGTLTRAGSLYYAKGAMQPMSPCDKDIRFMRHALRQAEAAWALGEVPIGSVVVHDGEIVGLGHNLRETDHDPTAHAEVIAIREAATHLGSWRLTGCTLYATIEPCPMCAGALVNARVDRLVYGAPDPKAGAVDTLFDIVRDPRLNHRVEVTAGILADECAALMRAFFRELRAR